jgi:hypothetical protein
MTAKQLSVFIENRQGRLGEVLTVVKNSGVNILSISLADTTEYGILRLIVNNPTAACSALIAAGFSGLLTDVLIVKIPHKAGSLQEILDIIAGRNISIEYMYGLSVNGEDASIVLKTNELTAAIELLKENDIETMTSEEISKH